MYYHHQLKLTAKSTDTNFSFRVNLILMLDSDLLS